MFLMIFLLIFLAQRKREGIDLVAIKLVNQFAKIRKLI